MLPIIPDPRYDDGMTSFSDFSVDPATDLMDALAEIRQAKLYDRGSADSHVEAILDMVAQEGLTTRHRDVHSAWLARDPSGRAVGMAIVSQERFFDGRGDHEVVNLFVSPQARQQGLGQRLIAAAKERHPRLQAHYTAEAIGLYERAGLPDFYRRSLPAGKAGDRLLAERHEALRRPATTTELTSETLLQDVLALAAERPHEDRRDRRRHRLR